MNINIILKIINILLFLFISYNNESNLILFLKFIPYIFTINKYTFSFIYFFLIYFVTLYHNYIFNFNIYIKYKIIFDI